MSKSMILKKVIRNGNNTKNYFTWFCSFLCCGLILSSCNGEATHQKITPSLLGTATSIAFKNTDTPTIVIPSSTETQATTPTINAITETFAVPELSEEQIDIFIDLFATNGGCDFPCWWGIQPGDPIQKAFNLAPIVGDSLYGEGKPDYYYSLSFDILNFGDLYWRIFVDKKKTTIRRMEITLNQPVRLREFYDAFERGLSISGVMQKFGEPEEILIIIYPRAEKDSAIAYSLLLSYQSRGFSIMYLGRVEHEDPLQICSKKLTDIKQQLYYLEMHVDTFDVIEHENSLLVKEGYQTLELTTSMTKHEFYRAFLQPDEDQCITTTYKIW